MRVSPENSFKITQASLYVVRDKGKGKKLKRKEITFPFL